jgi:hypothetical protein
MLGIVAIANARASAAPSGTVRAFQRSVAAQALETYAGNKGSLWRQIKSGPPIGAQIPQFMPLPFRSAPAGVAFFGQLLCYSVGASLLTRGRKRSIWRAFS